MTRTLATISTEKGIAAIIHDDQSMELTGHYSDGSVEQLGDYTPTASWSKARKQIIAWYGNTAAYHDSWVLCLRPIAALKVMHSEERFTSSASV